MKRCLIVTAKQPVAGQVKTRLAATLGEERAAALCRCALEDTLELVEGFRAAEPVISYAPPTSEVSRFFAELAPGWMLVPQPGASFGERLGRVFERLAHQGMRQMVMIGTDSPSLPSSYIDQAFEALSDAQVDAVLGRTSDGGYYLIGMRQPHPILFERITWSTASVAAETHARAAEANLRLVDIASWYDLDTADDLRMLLDDVAQNDDGRAPRTRAFIERENLVPRTEARTDPSAQTFLTVFRRVV